MKTFPFLIAAGLVCAACDKSAPPPPPPPEVAIGAAVQQDVPIYTEMVGQTSGAEDVEIRARVEGYVDRVAYTEGSVVHKGELMYLIDPKPFDAVLAGAKADLATWQARLDKTKNDVARYTPLAVKQAVSQQELDNAVAAHQAALAQVDAGKAAVDTATLNLSYTRVTCPVDGVAGTTKVKAGTLVGRGENTLLTTVSTINPIIFRAGIAEADYLRLRQQLQKSGAAADLKSIPIDLLLADGTTYAHSGSIQLAERQVDASTGTLMLQFQFPNPDSLLRPGQYGRARFVVERLTAATLVPQRAVQEMQGTYSVAVVAGDGTVAFRNVTVGPRMGTLWVIKEGLKPGDKVVVEGLQRVRDGMKVTPREMTKQASAASGETK